MKDQTQFPIEKIPQIQNNPKAFRLLEQIPPITGRAAPRVGDEQPIVFLDFETTGFDEEKDRVIELGIVRAEYSPGIAAITSVDGIASFYQDPGIPISPFITNLTGITDEDVRGQAITRHDLDTWLYGDPLIVAHNAQFDFKFFPQVGKGLEFVWACSQQDIDWRGLGFESGKLEYIALKSGYFYDGHRASVDCETLCFLLQTIPGAFEQLMTNAFIPRLQVLAKEAPFEVKDVLKSRGYGWIGGVWQKTIGQDKFEEEMAFLADLYPHGDKKATVRKKNPRKRFEAPKVPARR